MPRAPHRQEPDFREVVADLRKRGPLTQAFGASWLEKKCFHRSASGLPLPYNTRCQRGVQLIDDMLSRHEISEFEVAKAVYAFHADLATTSERAPVTPNYEYQTR